MNKYLHLYKANDLMTEEVSLASVVIIPEDLSSANGDEEITDKAVDDYVTKETSKPLSALDIMNRKNAATRNNLLRRQNNADEEATGSAIQAYVDAETRFSLFMFDCQTRAPDERRIRTEIVKFLSSPFHRICSKAINFDFDGDEDDLQNRQPTLSPSALDKYFNDDSVE